MKRVFLQFTLILLIITGNLKAQWSQYLLGEDPYPFDCFFINENTGWAAGANVEVYLTTNCGLNWNIISGPSPEDRIECIFFVNQNTGWAGTFYGNVRKTTNGGYNWAVTNVALNKYVLEIFFINENTGWLIGQDGLFKRTTNGGATWLNPSSFFSQWGYTVRFINSQTGFAGGHNNLAKTTNGGVNWDIMFLPNITIKVITFLNQQTGWGLGGRELVGAATGLYVLKTTNTGNNWNVICSDTATYGTYTRVNDAEFINENVGYYVGRWGFAPPPSSYYGILNKTTNGGISWFFPGGFSNNYSVEAITFVNYQTGFAVGDHNLQGIIYKTTNALGLETISSSAPSDFSLSQNYPNPFNPQTKIKFDIPKSSFTQIIIYDLLGREVATLVNEELKAGTYEADWDASGFSSGVYFYKITAGDFIETKKMVLMK